MNNNGNLGDLNHTLLALIPNVIDPNKVEEYRPISLCTVIYKTISKTVANRLKTYLFSLILQEQSAFMLGRHIVDNFLIMFETMHKIKSVKKGCSSWMALKLDMSKAYNSIEWSFLEAIMF